jgi:hypothetical protein
MATVKGSRAVMGQDARTSRIRRFLFPALGAGIFWFVIGIALSWILTAPF